MVGIKFKNFVLLFLIFNFTFLICNPVPAFAQLPKVVALTFDDGPKPELSQQVLDILDIYGIKATFFVVGCEIEQYPDIICRMSDSGSEIGNHSYSHREFNTLTYSEMESEIQKTNSAIFRVTGRNPKYFRSPGDYFDPYLSRILRKSWLTYVSSSINGKDYVGAFENSENGEDVEDLAKDLENRILKRLHPGAVILFHNGSPQTLMALPKIIVQLQKKGYGFVTLSELIEMGGRVRNGAN